MTSTLKSGAKAVFAAVLPGTFRQWQAARHRAHSEQLEREWGCTSLTRHLIDRYGPVVQRGPFEGLELPEAIRHRHLAPYLIGSYESALHPVWQDVLPESYAQVLDVGSASGYYAVGLSLRYESVIAFDTDPWARNVTAATAAANNAQLRIEGACTPNWLADHLRPGALLLIDCEGYEDQLIDVEAAPALGAATLIVECHEHPAPGVTNRLQDRLAKTHHIQLLSAETPDPADYPELAELSPRQQHLAVREFRRPDTQWLYAVPK